MNRCEVECPRGTELPIPKNCENRRAATGEQDENQFDSHLI
jgi:hypothetical protein